MAQKGRAQLGNWGVDLSGFDRRTRAQDDFDRFVNGRWKDRTPIPKKEARWGNFLILRDKSRQAVREILEDIAQDPDVGEGTNRYKLHTFYKLGMNARKCNREGADPLKEHFDVIDSIQTRTDLVKSIARLHLWGISVFWQTSVGPSLRDTRKMILAVDQGGFSLPERGYYFDEDKKDKREKYGEHVQKMFELLGHRKREAQEAAKIVMTIETKLAQKAWSEVELRNVSAQANYIRLASIGKLAPVVDWTAYFDALGVEDLEEFELGQIDFIQRVNAVIKHTRLDDLKIYMRWWLINRTADFLSDDFVKQDFDFWQRTMEGKETLRPRWERCVQFLGSAMGQALGQEYVKRYFPPEAKEKVTRLVDNLIEVMQDRIKGLDWMSASTKRYAVSKVRALGKKLGYPDKWRDYSGLEVKNDSLLDNWFRAKEFHRRRKIAQVGKPTDREEWHAPPQTVNAWINWLNNDVTFPAAILQPPFFDPHADDAVNYGAIGAVIGHEITHAFDDTGAQFDKYGNLKNWWGKKDKHEFAKRCRSIVEQFNKFEVFPDIFVNGELTQGENIADVGGLSIAYEAYQRSQERKNAPEKLDGFTPEQRFFLGFGQIWRGKARDDYLKKGIATDPHAPAAFRIKGSLMNTPEFFKAFDVEEGDAMWRPPDKRVKIW
ncbi:M13 family metallopeptidase [Patescibacteria group bacterium AH-259-L05]|nr:M13 family metallopeptidase [Patescibacteria group bacterium AH-259-L05]